MFRCISFKLLLPVLLSNANASFSTEEPNWHYQNPTVSDQQSKSVDLSKLPSLIQSISIMCNGTPVSIKGHVYALI